jgi:hypothetical protein
MHAISTNSDQKTQCPAALPVDRSNSLGDLAARIVDAHTAVGASARRSLEQAMQAGDLLIEAKDRVGPGRYLDWLKKACGIPRSTAALYVQLAEGRGTIECEMSNVGHLTIRAAVRLLKPRKKAEKPPRKRTPVKREATQLNSLTWSGATPQVRAKFIDAVGVREIWNAMTPENREALARLALAEQPARERPIQQPPPAPSNGEMPDLPDYLRRTTKGVSFETDETPKE